MKPYIMQDMHLDDTFINMQDLDMFNLTIKFKSPQLILINQMILSKKS
jgi:hypothetical protein